LSILIHLKHLRRLWGLPTTGDRIQESIASLSSLLSRIRDEQVATNSAWDELAELVLRRLARLDEADRDSAEALSDLKEYLVSLRDTEQEEYRNITALLMDLKEETRRHLSLRDTEQEEYRNITALLTELRHDIQQYFTRQSEDLTFLTASRAELLNWAESHMGYRAQFGLWINEPVAVRYEANRVTWHYTNERVVEIPFVLQTLAKLSIPSRILDIGSCESLVPLFLASLGHRVTALDIREYSYSHPRLYSVRTNIVDWCGDGQSYDAVVLLSTLEHIGLPCYSNEVIDLEADRKAMEVVHRVLRPGGTLILTVPFGLSNRDDFQRTYSASDLKELLQGFSIQRCGLTYRLDQRTWTTKWDIEPCSLGELEVGGEKVLLLEAARS
jgi:SAM-dependent methyltransferase